MNRIFILSPANSGGERARMLVRPEAGFDLARRLQKKDSGVTLGEVFSFLSGLYFRGKVTYAKAFANPPEGAAHAYVITTNRGLMPVDSPITIPELKKFSTTAIDAADPSYRRPLVRDCNRLNRLSMESQIVLLGSIATGKYIDILLKAFGDRLLFPSEFVGRGDMSRGGLMLRCVREGRELDYIPVAGATRNGKRPARLTPVPGILKEYAGVTTTPGGQRAKSAR